MHRPYPHLRRAPTALATRAAERKRPSPPERSLPAPATASRVVPRRPLLPFPARGVAKPASSPFLSLSPSLLVPHHANAFGRVRVSSRSVVPLGALGAARPDATQRRANTGGSLIVRGVLVANQHEAMLCDSNEIRTEGDSEGVVSSARHASRHACPVSNVTDGPTDWTHVHVSNVIEKISRESLNVEPDGTYIARFYVIPINYPRLRTYVRPSITRNLLCLTRTMAMTHPPSQSRCQ